MNKLLLTLTLLAYNTVSFGKAMIDKDILSAIAPVTVQQSIKENASIQSNSIAVIVFLKKKSQVDYFLEHIEQIPGIKISPLHFMPAVAAIIPKDAAVLYKIASHDAAAQISLNKAGAEELEASAQAILVTPSLTYPNVNNFWQQGYVGQSGVIGLIDSGIAVDHPGLSGKQFIIDKEADSGYDRYKNGVRTAHGTGAACIYAGVGTSPFSRDLGIAHGAATIVSGLAGEGDGGVADILMTTSTLDWMLNRAQVRPTVINYSFGNGAITCASCSDWSGLAKIVDYVVNHEKIMWVKSAGNQGLASRYNQSTMTSPANNFNGITVANMNITVLESGFALQTPNRAKHAIRYTSSRGPTLGGRRKPDITAPGNDTRTCAPDPQLYNLTYKPSMDYHDGYRLMGGTSSAAPHVGAAVLLLQDAGIKNPMASKALLINSADAWTDSGLPGPDDPEHLYVGGHYQVMGSEWNPTYGWGYINMQQAFDQRYNLIEGQLTIENPVKEYLVNLPIGGKVTLVHERRVGYQEDSSEWNLSALSIELYDADTQQLIAKDDSAIDTVHQVANCARNKDEKRCSSDTKPIRALVRVKLVSTVIDGSDTEPFTLAFG